MSQSVAERFLVLVELVRHGQHHELRSAGSEDSAFAVEDCPAGRARAQELDGVQLGVPQEVLAVHYLQIPQSPQQHHEQRYDKIGRLVNARALQYSVFILDVHRRGNLNIVGGVSRRRCSCKSCEIKNPLAACR